MDDAETTRSKRLNLGFNTLIGTFFLVNIGFLTNNFLYGEEPSDIATRNTTALGKVIVSVTLFALKERGLLSIKAVSVVFSSIVGLYLLASAFVWQPKYFLFASEAYRLTFSSLARLVSSDNAKAGVVIHFSYVAVWYFMCVYSQKFQEVEGLFSFLAMLGYCLGNELMHAYLSYRNSTSMSESITKITQLQQQIHLIFETIPEAVFVVKLDLSVIIRNRAAESVVAATSDYFLTEASVTLEDGSQVSLTQRVTEMGETAELGKSLLGERTYEWKASRVIWEGQPAVTLLLQDVTTTIQLEQAKHENNMKNVMMRSVSHELRTPANAFSNLLERTLKYRNLPPAARVLIELAQDNCKHLLTITNDLLDYSQFLHRSFRLAKRRFDLRKILLSSFKPYEYMIKAAGVTTLIEIDAELPLNCFNDPNRLGQVIMNLLSNAAKFTTTGVIKLTAVKTALNSMNVAVSDTGVGITLERQASLVSLFGRLREDESLNPEGCGLGLHISSLLAMHLGGGSLEVRSTVGEGSTFSFAVDLYESDLIETDYSLEVDEDKLEVAVPLFGFSAQAARVLVVDDNVFNRDIIVAMLEDIRVNCMAVSSGLQAIQAISQNPGVFQLMFLDYEMPELNGPQTARRLYQMLQTGELTHLPVIAAYTAYSDDRDIRECREAGMTEYIPKPCSMDQVQQLVLKHCAYHCA
jgi:signal transduction histidine kinase/CheY-like chemotaxis protein